MIILAITALFVAVMHRVFGDWSKSAEFSDTFGAVGVILSGVTVAGLVITILIQQRELAFQRDELALQREEMRGTRNEFLVNRITNIIYNQLERNESALNTLIFAIRPGFIKRGSDALLQFHDTIQTHYVFYDRGKTESQILKEFKKRTHKGLELYVSNSRSISQFALLTFNATIVVREVLLKSGLTLKEMHELRDLYFLNIGTMQSEVMRDIVKKYDDFRYLESIDQGFVTSCGFDLSSLKYAYSLMGAVLAFSDQEITEELANKAKEGTI